MHKVRAALMKTGAKAPILPAETRFHYCVDLMENFIDNRKFYRQLIAVNEEIERIIRKKDSNVLTNCQSTSFSESVVEFLEFAKPIKIKLKLVESDKCTVSKVAELGLQLRSSVENYESYGSAKTKDSFLALFKKYYAMALTAWHFAGVLIDANMDGATVNLLDEQEHARALLLLEKEVDEDFIDAWITNRYDCLMVSSLFIQHHGYVTTFFRCRKLPTSFAKTKKNRWSHFG